MSTQPRIAIIQLTRIGDLIQTLQATRQFRSENSGAHLTLIARRKFASGITFLLETVFDEIILFDTKDFFKDPNLKAAKLNVGGFFHKMNEKSFDFSINLSFSKSSSYLNSLIKSDHKLGLYRNDKTEISINDKWSQYVYSNVMNSANTPFCLVDIYRYIMGVNQTLVLDPDPNFSSRSNNIVLHPFASQRKKKWGISKWNELIYKMANDHKDYMFHIVGGPEDKAEAQRLVNSPVLQNLKDRIVVHAGSGNIAKTYQLLMDAKLFIGHDSMVSHLASETLTPTIVVSLGTVRPHETSPYNNNVINISPRNKCFPCTVEEKCELLPCHGSINHQIINNIATGMLNNESIDTKYLKSNLTPFHLDSVKIYKSEYDDNGLNHKEITNDYLAAPDVFKEYFKIIWQYYLRGVETNTQLPTISRETAQGLNSYIDGVNYLFELYNFGVTYSNKIIAEAESKNTDYKLLQDYISKLTEIDGLCSITKKNYPHLKGLVDYFYVNKANALGDNLIDISKHNLLNYYDASNLVAVLNDFIESSVKPHVSTAINLDREV